MIFTDEQYAMIERNIEEINKIMVNNSTSGISIKLRELINTIAAGFKWEACKTCNTVMYNQIATIYSFYMQDKKDRAQMAQPKPVVVQSKKKNKKAQ